jgi:DNA-binding MarR family transcriptional regulator
MMMTVIIEHEKRIKRLLSTKHNLTPSEFSILRSVELSGGSSTGLSIGGFLHLKHNSVSMALSNLKAQGLITKTINQADRRATDITITQKGIDATREATKDIYLDMKSTFWETMTDEDIRSAILVGSHVNRRLTSSDKLYTASFDEETLPISPEFIVNMKALPKAWDNTIKKMAGISMPEYRILNLLANSKEPLRSFDIAAKLLMDRAAVSRCKTMLEQDGYLVAEQNSADRRDAVLSCSVTGLRVEGKTTEALSAMTVELYSDLNANEAIKMNEWHKEMYDVLTGIK